MARGLDDPVKRQVAENATGGAVRLRDISGVGDQTVRQLRSKGFRNVQDVKSASIEELTRVPGIGDAKAKQIIRSAGGDPRANKKSSSGSVSAAGIRVPKGDFKAEIGDFDSAEARHESDHFRSENSRRMDERKRAPITTDKEKWQNNPGEFDFPGVDTPTSEPDVKKKDVPFIGPDDLTSDGQEEADGWF